MLNDENAQSASFSIQNSSFSIRNAMPYPATLETFASLKTGDRVEVVTLVGGG